MRSEFDNIDITIINALQKQGRLSHAAIAAEVHLSPSACLRRVKRLEDEGIISGYHARLSRNHTRQNTTVFVEISLDSLTDDTREEFESAVIDVAEVVNCHFMAGQFDYFLQVWCEDPRAYERLHRTVLSQLPQVTAVRSTIALRTIVERGASVSAIQIENDQPDVAV